MKPHERGPLWAIIVLITTTIVGPIIASVVVWQLREGKIEEVKLKLELHEDLTRLLDKKLALVKARREAEEGSPQIGRIDVQLKQTDRELEYVNKVLSDLTGKDYSEIGLPPGQVKGVTVKVSPHDPEAAEFQE